MTGQQQERFGLNGLEGLLIVDAKLGIGEPHGTNPELLFEREQLIPALQQM